MGFLFQEESAHEDHSVTILLKEDNVARKVVTFLLAKILDLDDDFWAAFCYEGWDTFRLQIALDTFRRAHGEEAAQVSGNQRVLPVLR